MARPTSKPLTLALSPQAATTFRHLRRSAATSARRRQAASRLLRCASPLRVTAPRRCGDAYPWSLLSEAGPRAGFPSKDHENQQPEPRAGVKARARARDPRSGPGHCAIRSLSSLIDTNSFETGTSPLLCTRTGSAAAGVAGLNTASATDKASVGRCRFGGLVMRISPVECLSLKFARTGAFPAPKWRRYEQSSDHKRVVRMKFTKAAKGGSRRWALGKYRNGPLNS